MNWGKNLALPPPTRRVCVSQDLTELLRGTFGARRKTNEKPKGRKATCIHTHSSAQVGFPKTPKKTLWSKLPDAACDRLVACWCNPKVENGHLRLMQMLRTTPSSIRLSCIVRLDMEETQAIQNLKLSFRCKVWTLILRDFPKAWSKKMSWPRGSSNDDLLQHVAEWTSPSNPNVVMSPTSELHNRVCFFLRGSRGCPDQRRKWHQQCECSTISEVWTIHGYELLHEVVGFLKCRTSWHCMVLNMRSVGICRDIEKRWRTREMFRALFVRTSCGIHAESWRHF